MLLDNDKWKDQIGALVGYAFNKTINLIQDVNFVSRLSHAKVFGVLKENKLVSMIMLNTFEMKYHDANLKLGAVGYVATYPENRGQGLINSLMNELFTYCLENNYDALNLAPFSQSFYRRYGFENTIAQKQYHFTNVAFKFLVKANIRGEIIRGTWQQPNIQVAVKTVYAKKIKDQINVIVRPAWWWDRLDTYYAQRKIAVYYKNKQPQGYVIYRFLDDVFQIDELTYLNNTAELNLLKFIGNHTSSFKKFYYQAGINTHLEDLFTEQNNIQITLCPYMMSRILNLPKLLQTQTLFAPNIVVGANDNTIAKNNANFKLTDVVIKTDQKADLIAPINIWAQLLLGNRDFEELIFENRIQVNTVKRYLRNKVIRTKTEFFDYY